MGRPQKHGLSTGARLLREWNGTTEVVDVLQRGYGWRGRTFRSLSATARAITGTNWSGPKFFGLLGYTRSSVDEIHSSNARAPILRAAAGTAPRDDASLPKPVRCAVYTRKSSEEGLEQNFNSLEAQREAGEAYTRSQASKGWVLIPDRFDDGGYSGGNLERPALDQLMGMVRERKIDVIVVYKIDRLTRSLIDFALLAEVFDKHDVSFVSVTQLFDTSDSAGRLMLNVLLSFAQFEREITAERIRDKIAASKRKGLWMGGPTPMGYDVDNRKLIVNKIEATRVRTIFRFYLEAPSAPALLIRLRAENIRTQVRTSARGNTSGGRWFTRGHIYKFLSNPVYLGLVSHKGVVHRGQHDAILDENTWSTVQEKLAQNTREEHKRRRRALPDAPLLADLLFTPTGNRMIPVSAKKAGRRYRYYAEVLADGLPATKGNPAVLQDSRNMDNALSLGLSMHGAMNKPMVLRLPAMELEALVVGALAHFLTEREGLLEHLGQSEDVSRAIADAENLPTRPPEGLRSLVRSIVQRVMVSRGEAQIEVNLAALRHALGVDHIAADEPVTGPNVTIKVGLTFRRRGPQFKLVIEGRPAASSHSRVT